MSELDHVIGLIGFAIGVISFGYAIYTQRQASRLREYQIKKLRTSLKDCIIIMSQSFRLMRDSEAFQISNSDALKRISAVHSISATLIRSLLHELSEIDLPYDENKLKAYVAAGLITSKWVWEQAVTFLKSSKPIPMPDLPEDTKDYYVKENA